MGSAAGGRPGRHASRDGSLSGTALPLVVRRASAGYSAPEIAAAEEGAALSRIKNVNVPHWPDATPPTRVGPTASTAEPPAVKPTPTIPGTAVETLAPGQVASAARRLEPLNLQLARDTYLDAFWAAMVFARLAGAMAEVATAARATPPPATPPRAADLLLDGLALLIADGYAAGTPVLKDALSAFVNDGPAEEGLRWRTLAADTAVALWDDHAWETILDRHLELARATGALDALPLVLDARLLLHLLGGEMTLAAARHDASRAVTEATGRTVAPYSDIMLAALRGLQADVDAFRETLLKIVVPRAQGLAVTLTWWASAVCANGLGRYEQALAAAEQAVEYPHELGFAELTLHELIEAASRSGMAERASVALERLTATTRPAGTDWGLGLEARCRALVSDRDVAEGFYRSAIDRLSRTRLWFESARAHLLYGEWLRRENRRVDAREHLRTATTSCTPCGPRGSPSARVVSSWPPVKQFAGGGPRHSMT